METIERLMFVGLLLAAVVIPPDAQQRAPAGTFPDWEVVCTEGGMEVLRVGARSKPIEDNVDGYIVIHRWDVNRKVRTNAVCVITDNRGSYR